MRMRMNMQQESFFLSLIRNVSPEDASLETIGRGRWRRFKDFLRKWKIRGFCEGKERFCTNLDACFANMRREFFSFSVRERAITCNIMYA